MTSPLILKLRHGARLTEGDEALLAGLLRQTRTVPVRRDIAIQGSTAGSLPIILDGWAYRYRLLENGKRQITALYLPGDLCEPFGALPRVMDSTIGTLTRVSIAQVAPIEVRTAAQSSPRLEEALWWDLLMATSIDQERLVSLGRRSAAERIGHLFCEIHLRLTMVGLADEFGYDLPITQLEISDMLGLTPVHVSRSLRSLKEMGLISLNRQRLIIHDIAKLCGFSCFDPAYIHADGAKPICKVDVMAV